MHASSAEYPFPRRPRSTLEPKKDSHTLRKFLSSQIFGPVHPVEQTSFLDRLYINMYIFGGHGLYTRFCSFILTRNKILSIHV